jgi:hypothetical protein
VAHPQKSLIDSLPSPDEIRRRLSDLATEANYLRSLLRLVERRPDRRNSSVTSGRQEVPSHVS